MSRAPFVAMLTDLRKEERVRFTADFCGYNEDEALGKFFRLWSWCTDRGLDDSPDDCEGYAVADPVVRRFLGPRGVDGILGDGCDELAMGERRPDGLIYLRGTHETVSRLRTLRATAVAGGRSAADRAIKIGRGKGGRFVSEQTITPADGPAGHQPDTSRTPAASSEIPPPTSHLPPPESDLSPAARAIPPSPVPAPNHEQARARGRLAESFWLRVSDARVLEAHHLSLTGVLPLPVLSPVHQPASFRELLQRIREEGELAATACDHVLTVLVEQARAERSIEWLSEKAFLEGSWRTARAAIPGSPRAGPAERGPNPRTPERKNPMRPM